MLRRTDIENAISRLTLVDGDQGLERAGATDPSTMLPEELMAEIFSYLCSTTLSESELDVLPVDTTRALGPFGVAGVSRRWRDVALSRARLWHYIAIHHFSVDKNPSAVDNTLGYISIVLERSRDTPVDINIEYMRDDPPMAYLRILDALAPARHRWRRFCLTLQTEALARKVLDMLSEPTPLLRTLQVSVQQYKGAWTYLTRDVEIPSIDARVLPHAPALRVCALINVPLMMLPHSAVELPALETFDYTQHVVSLPGVQDVLERFTNIRELTIGCETFDGLITHDVVLPELEFLGLLGRPADDLLVCFLERLKMPKLWELAVSDCAPERMADGLKALSPQLQRLCWLNQDIKAADVDALAALVKLAGASFVSCTLPGALMDRLCETHAEAIMWPQLAYMKLDDAWVDDVPETQSVREPRACAECPRTRRQRRKAALERRLVQHSGER